MSDLAIRVRALIETAGRRETQRLLDTVAFKLAHPEALPTEPFALRGLAKRLGYLAMHGAAAETIREAMHELRSMAGRPRIMTIGA